MERNEVMGCTKRATEYYVRVDPRRIGWLGEVRVSDTLLEPDEDKRLEMYHDTCEAIVDQIKRHVDDVGSVTTESEKEVVCEFCGSPWTEDADSPHNGGCCEEDCAVYEAVEEASCVARES